MDEKRLARNEKYRKRKQKRRRKQRQQLLLLGIGVVSLLIIICLIVMMVTKGKKDTPAEDKKGSVETSAKPMDKTPEKTEKDKIQDLLQEAELLAAGYDYDGAMEKIKSFQGYEQNQSLTEAVSKYQTAKDVCVPVNVNEITHVFYHSLVVDPDRAFANQETNNQAKGNNQWMTTVDEFNKITQTMYEEGYVLVDLHDIAEQTTDENGNASFKPGTILLPPGKKAYVMSLDDLSYYHSYSGYGFASKMVLDENGKPKCEYIQADGTTVVGDYDVVPLLDKFVEEHPDASYKGAKGTIALTGYNGVLGYRTDITYQTVPADINTDKKKWLEENPDFNLDEERTEAKKVADVMKKDGWYFASHTWGHQKIASITLEKLQADTQRWVESVEPVVGTTDTIIFAHGEDLGGWGDYDQNDPKFQYLKGQGYNYFCNVDSTQYQVQIRDNYVRQGRRNLDGYRIYQNAIGSENNLTDLFDAKSIIDPKRPPVLPLS